jgi:hypothetical protein
MAVVGMVDGTTEFICKIMRPRSFWSAGGFIP